MARSPSPGGSAVAPSPAKQTTGLDDLVESKVLEKLVCNGHPMLPPNKTWDWDSILDSGPNVMRRMTQEEEEQWFGPSYTVSNCRGVPIRRVGVPGGRQDKYGTLRSFFSWPGSSFNAALTSSTFYLHLVIYAILTTIMSTAGTTVFLPDDIMKLLNFACTFNIVFYSVSVIGRYNARFDVFCKIDGACVLITCHAAAQLKGNKARASLLMRYTSLILHIMYMKIASPLNAAKWQKMVDRGVLMPHEREVLQKLKAPAEAVYVWAYRILDWLETNGKINMFESQRLEENLSTVRCLAAKQVLWHFTPIPKPYFHLMTMLTHVYLFLIEIKAANDASEVLNNYDEDKHGDTGPEAALLMIIFTTLVALIVLVAMWNTAVWLSDPIGLDITDYDVDVDLRFLWSTSLEAISKMSHNDTVDDAADAVVRATLSPFRVDSIGEDKSAQKGAWHTRATHKGGVVDTGGAFAAKPTAAAKAKFASMDADGDGIVSKEEFLTTNKPRPGPADTSDAADDGADDGAKLLAEIDALNKAHAVDEHDIHHHNDHDDAHPFV